MSVIALACFPLGCGGDGSSASVRQARTDRWVALAPAILSRTEVGAARIGRNVYVVGGFERKSGRTTRSVERYDIDRNHWSRAAAMPIGVNHPAVTAYRGQLYVLGGYTSSGGLSAETRRFFRFDPPTKKWTELPSAPTKRAAHVIGAVGGRLFAAGGAAGGKALTLLEIYNPATRKWKRGPSMRTAREHLAAVAAGGYLYVLAGRGSGRGNFKVAERYESDAGRWEQLPDMRKSRGGIAAAAARGRIVVFGGEESAGTIREVEAYDPATRRWSRLPDLLTPRHGLGGVSLGSRIYAIEGGPQPGLYYSNAIEVLDLP